jgi:uncharacterized protein (TIGR04255 family)
MSKKLKMWHAPVYYALVQAQFNPIANMVKYVDEIQDQLRQSDYTLFDPKEVTHLQFGNTAGQEPKVAHSISWVITKEDRSAGFILTTSSLTFHTTHYRTKEEFIPELLRGLEIVHNGVKLSYLNRLGLRYLDAVLPLPKETVAQYLVGGLHGIDFKAERNYSFMESVFDTECSPLLTKGKLISRVMQRKAALGYPSDIMPYGLVPMKRFEIKDTRSHGIIDTDHFVEGRMPLDFAQLKEQLLSLHATHKLAFEATITDHAKRVWSGDTNE